MIKTLSESVTVYGNMDWFSVAEQPDSLDALPADFAEAKSLWEQSGKQCTDDVIAKLQQYVNAWFVAVNLDGWVDYISDKDYGEFIATKVRVVGLDFKESPIPLCKAEAWFNVTLKEGISADSIQSWVADELDGTLYGAISFGWEIDGEDLEDLDLTFGDNAGAEGIIWNGSY